MTVIVALRQHGETWIGADSQRSFGNIRVTPVQKLMIAGGVALGIAGFERTGALVYRNAEKVFADCDPFLIGQRIRDLVKEDGYQGGIHRDDHNGPLGYGCDMIIATKTGVFFLSEDFTPTQIPDGTLWAAGSGMEYALGAGNVASDAPTEGRINAAILAACRFDKSCGAPAVTYRLGDPLMPSAVISAP